jgi:hypothetical protein
MEAIDNDDLFTDEFLETSCLAREECAQELLKDAAAGCFYCALATLEDDED